MPDLFAGLVEFGWSEFFARNFAEHGQSSNDLTPARVITEHRSIFHVQTSAAELPAHVAGKLRHQATCRGDLPAVGDWVVVQLPTGATEVTIHRVLPRRSKFSRKVAGDRTDEQIVAANVDVAWIVSSLDQDFNLRRLERYLALAYESGAAPVIILNKSDLAADVATCQADVAAIAAGTPVHVTNSLSAEGVADLRVYFRNHATVALLGSSGVGKSTLVNALAGGTLQPTGEVRQDGKGRHTTIHRQLLRLPGGGLIIDSPGMRELQLWDSQAGLEEAFGDVDALAAECRYSDCRHAGEPGCAVARAIERGEFSEDRLASYHKLNRELEYLERKQDSRARQEEKRRWRSIHKSLRNHPKYRR